MSECVCESANDWRRANVFDQCARIYEKWNPYNISIVFVSKLIDMYIVFEEKLLVYLFCLQNKWNKQKTILVMCVISEAMPFLQH